MPAVPPLPDHLTNIKLEIPMSIAKLALVAAVGLFAVSAAAPASAHYKRHHHRHHVWVHHGYGPYAYAPRHRARVYSGSTENERRCRLSPGSQAYEPCLNKF
jgi:hypothetical protein